MHHTSKRVVDAQDSDPAGDIDIVTVSAAGASTAHAEDALLERLKHLPQVR